MERDNKAQIPSKLDRRWFACLDLSMFAVAMIVKPRLGFGYKFPLIVASPWLATAAGHYFGGHPHVVSGIGYSLLTLHALFNTLFTSGFRKYRQMLYVPLLVGFAGLNFHRSFNNKYYYR